MGAAYLALRYLNHADTASQIFVQASAVVGVFSGLVAGGIVRVWRDDKTELIFQFGGWRYAAVLFGLLAFRMAWRLFVDAAGIGTSVALLNDGLIALGIGNYLGRTLHVGVRALHLAGWKPHLIPRYREVRRVRPTRTK